MEWVSLLDYENGMNFDDRPRLLTQEELAYVTAHVPFAPSADSTAAEVSRQCVVEWVTQQLSELAISPSAIPELIQNIIHQHNKSLIAPGTPIGITAAEAVGASTTQMTLNSVAPWEKIVIQDSQGKGHIVEIGDWIDQLIEANKDKVKHIPENRTQYLELSDPVTIASPNKDGKVTWDPLTAVTKHLPVGDLVKVTTRSGREVTATQSKSLLVWNGKELVGTCGSDIKVGDLVPILAEIPEPEELTYKSYNFGCTIGSTLNDGEQLTASCLFGHVEFIRGIVDTYQYSSFNPSIEFLKARLGMIEGDTHNNILLDPVASVEMVPPTEFVYDVTVPNTLNFSLFNGLGIRDTFHTSGSAKSASFGINAMRDLIFARKVPKNESSTIYYTNKSITYEEVLESQKDIVGNVVKDFITDYDIDSPQALQRFWWHDLSQYLLNKTIPNSTNVLRLYLNTVEMFKQKVTIADLAAVLEREMPPSSVTIYGPIGDGIIDVYPKNALIDDKIREKIPQNLIELTYLETIVVPELANIRVKGIAGIRGLHPIVSPVWRMVIKERKVSDKDLSTQGLRNLLEPHLGKAWFLFFNKNIMKSTGLIDRNLSALCKYAGLEILGGNGQRMVVSMPADSFRTFDGETIYNFAGVKYRKLDRNKTVEEIGRRYREVSKGNYQNTANSWKEKIDDKIVVDLPEGSVIQKNGKVYKLIIEENLREMNGDLYEIVSDKIRITEIKPSEYVNTRVSFDKKQRSDEIDRLTKERVEATKHLPEVEQKLIRRKPIIVPRTNLMKAAEFVIAETDGDNLKKLLALPGIDKRRTTCNNMHTIADTLGIEAARCFLIQALNNTISNTGNYVNPANILFIAEFITNRGKPYGATYTGISRTSGGHLSLATVERAGKVFIQNALHDRKEDIRNVSASVAVGARMAIGSGFFDVAQDITENGVTRTVINEDLFTALDNDDATQALQTGVGDVEQALDALNALKMAGASFDYTGGDDEANLIGLFNEGEIIPEVTAQLGQPKPQQQRVVRRVQPSVPTNLIDALAQVKQGIPLPETDARIEITPLEGGVTIEDVRPAPIISTGIFPDIHINFDETAGQGIPRGLEALLNQYFEIAGMSPEEDVQTEVVDLPTEDIPDLGDFDFAQGEMEMRREQVKDLKPIDIDALSKGI